MAQILKKVVNSKVSERLISWGQCIRAQRISQRVTEKDLCSRISISKPTLYRLQQGSANVSADTYLEALLALGVMDFAAPQLPVAIVEPLIVSQKIPLRVRRTKKELDNDF